VPAISRSEDKCGARCKTRHIGWDEYPEAFSERGSPFSTSANQTKRPMRVLWLHLADLFLSITAPAQFGFLGLSNNERHPGFRLLMRRYRGLENALRVISDIGRIGWVGESSRLSSVDIAKAALLFVVSG
jgi:hypothetical protein